MDFIWLTVALVLGLAARSVGLPPLVGFLLAGFALDAVGVQAGEMLGYFADLGVTLLLFTIGLKLRPQTMFRSEIWAGASLHLLFTVLVFGSGIFGLSAAGFSLFADLDVRTSLLIAFALSFSSTVFAVKVLEEKGEMTSLHARVSIGILVMQDIFAVIFITFSTGKIPSPWVLALPVALFAIRPLLGFLLDRCGHGELLILFGFAVALVVGYAGFELVDLKGDIGALVMGALIAAHPKAPELAKSLFGFKDLFLVGFFLQIGLAGDPTLQSLGIAALLAVAVVIKLGLYFLLLTRFKLRARTATLATLSLANYSEFGLLVGGIGVANGWIAGDWLVIIALALSFTFVLASPLNTAANAIYERFATPLHGFETTTRLPDDQPLDPGDAKIFVFGMGRVGASAYDEMRARHGEVVVGIDCDAQEVEKHREAGRSVILDDATDPDFWERVRLAANGRGRIVMLALPVHAANLYAVRQLTRNGFPGVVAATARFPDEARELEEAGAHAAFDLYAEAGTGFADHVGAQVERLAGDGLRQPR